jgi:hypothetical protein
MRPGLRYTTETHILGRINRSEVEVREMIPDRLIVTQSRAGLVEFTAEYHLEEKENGHCRLNLYIHMSFSPAIFNLARPVVEGVAEARIRSCLEKLSSMLADGTWDDAKNKREA